MISVNHKDNTDFVIITLIVVYAILFEWRMFAEAPRNLIYPVKIFLPLFLLLIIPLKKVRFKYYNKFALFFGLFLLWGLIPSVFSDYPAQTIIQWFKFLPRMLFFILISVYLLRKPIASISLAKMFVMIGFLAVIQFFLLTLTTGKYGVVIPGIPFPFYRLVGFWFEPSKASGFLFASFFLANAICTVDNSKFWKLASYLCLIGGFLCLSNAGYLAIIMALLFGVIVRFRASRVFTQFRIPKGALYRLFVATVLIGLVVLVFAGRSLVAEKYYHISFFRTITGVRGAAEVVLEAPWDHRVGLLKANIPIWLDNPFGIGFRIPGKTASKDSFWLASATAPILWLTYTGFIGLLLLLLREAQVLITSLRFSRQSDYIRNVCQAWVAMFTQNIAYGTWMTPFYLILCALVFCAAYNASFFHHITSTSPATSIFSYKNTSKQRKDVTTSAQLRNF